MIQTVLIPDFNWKSFNKLGFSRAGYYINLLTASKNRYCLLLIVSNNILYKAFI